MQVHPLIWAKRILLLVPLLIAATLNLFVAIARPLNWRSERIAGYGFLFASPWAWLVDHDWFGPLSNRRLEPLIGYLLMLWIPALLYSGCLWLLLLALQLSPRRTLHE
jgi:hypothetical protein